MLCSPNAGNGPVIHTRTVTLGPGQTAEAVLRATAGVPALITRLLFGGSGAGPFGTEGVYLTQARVGNRYLTGGLTPGALTGAPNGEVALDALVRFFSRVRLSTPIALLPGYDLVLTFRNDSSGDVTLSVADDRDRHGPSLTAAAKQAAAAGHQPTLFALTAQVPAGASRHEVEVPQGAAPGLLSTFALSATKERLVRASMLVAGQFVVQDAFVSLVEAVLAQGLPLPQTLQLRGGERVWLEVSNASSNTERISFFAELDTQGAPLSPLPAMPDAPMRQPASMPLPGLPGSPTMPVFREAPAPLAPASTLWR